MNTQLQNLGLYQTPTMSNTQAVNLLGKEVSCQPGEPVPGGRATATHSQLQPLPALRQRRSLSSILDASQSGSR